MRLAKPIPPISDADAQRFWAGIVSRGFDVCWPGVSTGDLSCYSAFLINGKAYYKHRIAYSLTQGDIPEGKIVCHTCDRKGCVNPRHLYAGTHQTNARDRELARDLQYAAERRVKFAPR